MTDIYPIKPIILEPYKFIWLISLIIPLLVLLVKNLFSKKQKIITQTDTEKSSDFVKKLKKLLNKLEKINIEDKKAFYKQIYSIIVEYLEAFHDKKLKNCSLEELKKTLMYSDTIPKNLEKIYLQLYGILPDNIEERKKILTEIKNLLEKFLKANEK